MIKILLATVLMSTIILLMSAKAQVIPDELLGDWLFQYEDDACGNIIASGCDLERLNISPYHNNSDLDTLLITEFKIPDESYTAHYHMTAISSEPETYQFTNLDSTTAIDLWEFLNIYDSDSLVFNWTTMDPGVAKNFEFVFPDSLIFSWTSNCQACHCAGKIHFTRLQTSNNSPLASSEEWKIYPNPAKNFISLENIWHQNNTISKISLIDSKGVIHREILTSEPDLEMSIENLQSGLYYLKIENDKGIVLKKLAIIH